MILLDTNILIEVLRGSDLADRLEKMDENFAISAVTEMELYFGARDKRELRRIMKFLAGFEIIHLDEPVSRRATELIAEYAKSHRLAIPDALIAATALIHNLPLLTLNKKDFRYIEGIELIKI